MKNLILWSGSFFVETFIRDRRITDKKKRPRGAS